MKLTNDDISNLIREFLDNCHDEDAPKVRALGNLARKGLAAKSESDQCDAVLEEAAKLCEDMQIAKNATVPDGKWRTLGDTEIDGQKFAVAIRALKRSSTR